MDDSLKKRERFPAVDTRVFGARARHDPWDLAGSDRPSRVHRNRVVSCQRHARARVLHRLKSLWHSVAESEATCMCNTSLPDLGFDRVAAMEQLWERTTKDTQQRLNLLQFCDWHGLSATVDAFGVSRCSPPKRVAAPPRPVPGLASYPGRSARDLRHPVHTAPDRALRQRS